MTAYTGGKFHQGKTYAEIIGKESLGIADEEGWEIQGYCEPFCGMLGVYQHIPQLFQKNLDHNLKYKAGDINKSVIMMWKAAQNGWKPSSKVITKKQFMKMQGDGKSSARKGFVGHAFAYMGKYFKPFRERTKQSLDKDANRVSKIAGKLKKVSFSHGLYTQYSKLKGYVIYCDPPYQQQSQYYDENNKLRCFNHNTFWEWCRKMSEDNLIFISEYKAPKDFEKIYTNVVRTSGKNKNEHIYVI